MVQWKQIQLGTMRSQVRSLASLSGLKLGFAMSCDVNRRRSLDLTLWWLRRRPAAVAPIQPQAWESPYAAGAALKSEKEKFLLRLSG